MIFFIFYFLSGIKGFWIKENFDWPVCVAYWHRLKEPCPSHPWCRTAAMVPLHGAGFHRTGFPFSGWLCVSAAESLHSYAKLLALSSWQQHLIQGRWFALIIVIFFFSHQTLHGSLHLPYAQIRKNPPHTSKPPWANTPQQMAVIVLKVHRGRKWA